MALKVLRPGMLTTVQDLGRWGWQGFGVPVAGPMDAYSHRLANCLAGNDRDAAALEITLMGPELEADTDTVCVVAGARFKTTVNGVRTEEGQPFVVPAGGRVNLGARLAGARATFAVRGGFDVPTIFGSRATSVVSRIGPFNGRALRAGDVLPTAQYGKIARPCEGSPLPLPAGGARVRIMRGPQDALFTTEAVEALCTSRFAITPQSNRMGYRLDGPLLHRAGDHADILSDATPFGSIQVPAAGTPILLMADRQTTGGYPRIATVISADLPIAGQLAPGDWIEFQECTREEALDALRERERELGGDPRG
jgi:antagonist of KipI